MVIHQLSESALISLKALGLTRALGEQGTGTGAEINFLMCHLGGCWLCSGEHCNEIVAGSRHLLAGSMTRRAFHKHSGVEGPQPRSHLAFQAQHGGCFVAVTKLGKLQE